MVPEGESRPVWPVAVVRGPQPEEGHMFESPLAIRRVTSVALAFGLLAAACGDDADDPEPAGSGGEPTTTTVDDTVDDDGSGEEAAPTSVTDGDAPVTTVPADDEDGPALSTTTPADEDGGDDIEGQPLDFGPQVGTGLAIVGVAYDDELNFRDGPSVGADIVTSLAPLSDDLDMSALGEAWAAPSGVWWKVAVVGEEVWANQAYLGSLGSTFDGFDAVASELGVLKFEDVESAALAVAATRASDEPESRFVFAGEPLAFDVGGFAIVDVLDLGDDSVKGERLRIDVDIVFDAESGEPGAQDVAFVVLTGVDITPICGRGTSEGLCV